VSVSGSGNVAQYAVEKAMALGAKVVTVSDSSGTVIDEDGFTPEKLAILMDVKNHHYGRVSDYAQRTGVKFEAGVRPWHVPVDVALPCATQNELDENDAQDAHQERRAVRGRRRQHALDHRSRQGLRGRRRAVRARQGSNAGGVATSGLEMSQNAMRLSWMPAKKSTPACTDHAAASTRPACKYGKRADGSVSYIDGANVAGFVKVADAMLAQGVI
jgi:glutamate dehydrogenase (NADP+)